MSLCSDLFWRYATVRVLTRRVLLSHPRSSSSPLRVVAHIDVDCAYASMEIARLKYDPTLPFAVQQWNACLAVNYPSRKWGVKRIDTPAEARRKCPTIKIVHIASYRPGDLIPGDWPDARPETHKVRTRDGASFKTKVAQNTHLQHRRYHSTTTVASRSRSSPSSSSGVQ